MRIIPKPVTNSRTKAGFATYSPIAWTVFSANVSSTRPGPAGAADHQAVADAEADGDDGQQDVKGLQPEMRAFTADYLPVWPRSTCPSVAATGAAAP